LKTAVTSGIIQALTRFVLPGNPEGAQGQDIIEIKLGCPFAVAFAGLPQVIDIRKERHPEELGCQCALRQVDRVRIVKRASIDRERR
jgi:hypothetical protein